MSSFSTTCTLRSLCLILMYSITRSLNTKCQIQTGLFPTSGAQIFNTSYSSGYMLLYYKIWIPPNIDITATNLNDTLNIAALVLVHGSGPQNHDQQISVPSSPDFWTFRDIADALCTHYNIIVFTYDKRSCSPYSAVPCLNNQPPFCTINNTENDWCLIPLNITYLDFVGDAINAVQYIQDTYSFINPLNIVPVGHSQGASIVPIVADYMNLSTAVALMGTGIPIDIVLLYQQESLGVNQSIIDEEALTFKMIKNGSLNGWTLVNILGTPIPAIFWKQWLDAETNVSRLIHLKALENILTINSNADWNVPPFTYEPLHDLIHIVSRNLSYNLHAAMNVFPNMIHQMVSIDDVIAVRYNVSDDIIYCIGSWINGIFQSPSNSPTISPSDDDDDDDDDIVFSLELNETTFIISIFIAIFVIFTCLLCIGYIFCLRTKQKNIMEANRDRESVPLMQKYQSLDNNIEKFKSQSTENKVTMTSFEQNENADDHELQDTFNLYSTVVAK